MSAPNRIKARTAATASKSLTVTAVAAAQAGHRLYQAMVDGDVGKVGVEHALLAEKLSRLSADFAPIRDFVVDGGEFNADASAIDLAIAESATALQAMNDAALSHDGRKFLEATLQLMAALRAMIDPATRLHRLARRRSFWWALR